MTKIYKNSGLIDKKICIYKKYIKIAIGWFGELKYNQKYIVKTIVYQNNSFLN